MTTTPPAKPRIPTCSASSASASRWLVGSSRIRTCGFDHMTEAMLSRAFWPPERTPIGRCARSPAIPNPPRWLRTSWGLGNGVAPLAVISAIMNANALPSRYGCSLSSWCCATVATRSPCARCTSPQLAVRLPSSSRTSVVLPTPFSPRTPMRLLTPTWSVSDDSSTSPSPADVMERSAGWASRCG
mmetsp:Transcript_34311/g.90260  ORF Transcript_34311/g.90260 Transcript_34311/m.90260 type:complete len:186 (+) Transcript_34311:275-832(+)